MRTGCFQIQDIYWMLLMKGLMRKPNLKEESTPLLLPYRTTSISPENPVAKGTNLKDQVAVLNMISELSKNERSASVMEIVLKKVSSIVVGIACSGVIGLHNAYVSQQSHTNQE
jgi:hypothetical protein